MRFTRRDFLSAVAGSSVSVMFADRVLRAQRGQLTGKAPGKIAGVELLGHRGPLAFTQDAQGLKVKMPAEKPGETAYALKVSGMKLT